MYAFPVYGVLVVLVDEYEPQPSVFLIALACRMDVMLQNSCPELIK